MTIRCPLCEEVIESEVKLADGQHMCCPFCEKKFSFFYNTPEEKSEDVMPVIIASGEEFEWYLCEKINQQEGMQCEQTKITGDQGVDLIVRVADKKIAVQCKLYSTPVGNDAVQEVFAGMNYYECDYAVVVTNNSFTKSAIDLSEKLKVELLHYNDLIVFLERLSGIEEKRIKERIKDEMAAVAAYCREKGELASLEMRFVAHFLHKDKFIPNLRIDDVGRLISIAREKGQALCNETLLIMLCVIERAFIEMPDKAKHLWYGQSRKQNYGNISFGEEEKTFAIGYLNAWQGLEKIIKIIEDFAVDSEKKGLPKIIPITKLMPTYVKLGNNISHSELIRRIRFCKNEYVGNGISFLNMLYGKKFADWYQEYEANRKQDLLIKKIESLSTIECLLLKKAFSLSFGISLEATSKEEELAIRRLSDFGFCYEIGRKRFLLSSVFRQEVDRLKSSGRWTTRLEEICSSQK